MNTQNSKSERYHEQAKRNVVIKGREAKRAKIREELMREFGYIDEKMVERVLRKVEKGVQSC